VTKRVSAVGAPRIGVIQFPGSNCDEDCVDAFARHFDIHAMRLWHQNTELPPVDALVIPGGFSFGDYLRSGALAAHSPMMQQVRKFASRGGPIIGICNGFQILTESHLLPGALLHNLSQRFICQQVIIKDDHGRQLSMPIAHGEGRYWLDEGSLRALEDEGRIAFQYCLPSGVTSFEANPNGSVANIAGVYSKNKKILGMMPHPERATDCLMGGSSDGLIVMSDFLNRI
jgi:phosphoribosylformylglycinamidine synthase